MAKGIGQIHVRGEKGKVVITGMGQTPRGQRYIKEIVRLKVSSMGDKDFKGEMRSAVGKLLADQPSPIV